MNPVSHPSASPRFVQEYAEAAERFAEAVGAADLDAPVAACPGWSVRDLVVHLGNTHAWAATVVETGREAPDQDDRPASRRARGVAAWYLAKAEDLYRVLLAAPPDRPCWNFASGAGVAAFWPRRQLHETTIHLVDLEGAAGRVTDLAADVSVDGVDEVLTVMVPRMHRRGHATVLDAPVEVLATDTGDGWVLLPPSSGSQGGSPGGSPGGSQRVVPPPSVQRVRGNRSGSVPDRVEAPAEVLYRGLWHREVDRDAVLLVGDEARLRRFLGSRLTP